MLRKALILFSVCCTSLVSTASLAIAQDVDVPIDQDSLARMKHDLQIIASDGMEGRGPGTEGIDKAADYIYERWTIGAQDRLVRWEAISTIRNQRPAGCDGQEEQSLDVPWTKRSEGRVCTTGILFPASDWLEWKVRWRTRVVGYGNYLQGSESEVR